MEEYEGLHGSKPRVWHKTDPFVRTCVYMGGGESFALKEFAPQCLTTIGWAAVMSESGQGQAGGVPDAVTEG